MKCVHMYSLYQFKKIGSPIKCIAGSSVARSVDIVVVLPMSTSWMHAYAGAHGFDPELRQYASRVPCPCGLTVVHKISPPLNLASRDITCAEWNRQ